MENDYKVPPAKDFLPGKLSELPGSVKYQFVGLTAAADEALYSAMVEFARLHVEKALRAAALSGKLLVEANYGSLENRYVGSKPQIKEENEIKRNHYGHGDCTYEIITVSRDSIINAYPSSNII